MNKNILLTIWYKVIGAPFRLFPIKKKRIVFSNFFGRGYSDSPKYIAQEILRRNLEYELIWFIKDQEHVEFPDNLKTVKRGTLAELYYLSTAAVWIDNSRKHSGVTKRKKQLYIQTWHGGIALKKIEADAIDTLSKSYIKSAKRDSKMIDVLLSNSKKFTSIFRSAFWYKGTILEEGLPRSDIFFKDEEKYAKYVKRVLGISNDTNLVLYAPTFRENNDTSIYSIDYCKILQTLNKYWGGRWAIIIRLHPNISNLQNKINYSEYIVNGSNYTDINHLIMSSQLIITDYSSCMFDGMLARKRVILYTPDADVYYRERGTYFKLEELPFPCSYNNSQLTQLIENYNANEWQHKYEEFKMEIGLTECGSAAKKVVDYIVDHT